MIAFVTYEVKKTRGTKPLFRLDKHIILRTIGECKMPYIKSICRAGKTKEIAKYYTRRFQPGGEKRSEKKKETTEQQQKVNDRQLARKLTYLLNANFDNTSRLVTFSYKAECRPDTETMKRQKRELLKKMRKVYKDEGKTLKYVEVAEVGERGAMHIHMVINDIDMRKIEKLWNYGFVTSKTLDKSGQYRKLAEYFIKYYQKTRKTAEKVQSKAYNCSRNLKRPEPKKHVMKGMRISKKIEIPKGWYLDKESVREGITDDGYQFFSYTLIECRKKHMKT